MDFESDAAAEFLSREKEVLGSDLGEIVNNNDEMLSEPHSSSDDFVMVNNEEEESFVGMQIPSTNVTIQKEVPEKIRLWQENQTIMLEKKDQDEKESIERLRQEGKEELSKWMENNKTHLEKIKTTNRLNDSSLTNGNESTEQSDNEMWKSIYELCEFSQQKIKNGRDTSRMKSVFLQMKQNPLNKTA